MNKDLELILNKLSNDIDINNKMQRVDSVFYHLFDQLSSNDEKVLNIYGKYKINDIVSLIKIERLFDLGIISDEEKKILVDKFNEYRAVNNKTNILNLDVIERKDNLEEYLNRYGILDKFSYEDAIRDKIDKDIYNKVNSNMECECFIKEKKLKRD